MHVRVSIRECLFINLHHGGCVFLKATLDKSDVNKSIVACLHTRTLPHAYSRTKIRPAF